MPGKRKRKKGSIMKPQSFLQPNLRSGIPLLLLFTVHYMQIGKSMLEMSGLHKSVNTKRQESVGGHGGFCLPHKEARSQGICLLAGSAFTTLWTWGLQDLNSICKGSNLKWLPS